MVTTGGRGSRVNRAERWFPVVGKQFVQSRDGVRGNAGEHIVEPRERLDAAPLAGSEKASQHGRCLATVVATEERPVAAAERDVAVGSFRGAVVDLQLAVLEKSRQGLPLVKRIAHCGARRTLRQHFRLQLEQIPMELVDQPRRYSL